jgi:uncharacterized RDD family membrane protein YckC
MKCPKCGYLGFEQVDRCRNCGYDFSLAQPPTLPDLAIRTDRPEHIGSTDELALIDAAALGPSSPPREASADLDRREAFIRSTGSTPELPLFGRGTAADEPLIAKPSLPRPPLSVRRATPDVPRLRSERRASGVGMPDSLSFDVEAPAHHTRSHVRDRAEKQDLEDTPQMSQPAGVADRLLASLIDVIVLAMIDLVAVYFTMQVCGLPLEDLGLLPKGPLFAFFILQNGGYFVAFTAGGQTLGKMAAGIRVVTAGASGSPDLKHALLRTLVWVALAAPAGLGFMTALFSRDGRGLHDRWSGTQVVRAH